MKLFYVRYKKHGKPISGWRKIMANSKVDAVRRDAIRTDTKHGTHKGDTYEIKPKTSPKKLKNLVKFEGRRGHVGGWLFR